MIAMSVFCFPCAVRLDFSGLDAAAKLRDRKNRGAWVSVGLGMVCAGICSCCCACLRHMIIIASSRPASYQERLVAGDLPAVIHLSPICFAPAQEREVLASIEEMRAELSRLAPNLKASTCNLVQVGAVLMPRDMSSESLEKGALWRWAPAGWLHPPPCIPLKGSEQRCS